MPTSLPVLGELPGVPLHLEALGCLFCLGGLTGGGSVMILNLAAFCCYITGGLLGDGWKWADC